MGVSPFHKLLPVLVTVMLTAAAVVAVAAAPAGAAFWLGGASMLSVALGLAWLSGVRYPDVGWMVVATALIAAEDGLAVLGYPVTAPIDLLSLRLIVVAALAAFLLSFHRFSGRGRVELGFTGLTLGVIAVTWLGRDVWGIATSVALAAPSYAAAILLAASSLRGILALWILPPKRRRYVAAMSLACLLFAGAYVAKARGITELRLDYLLAAVFAQFLLADLVIFHRLQSKEKQEKSKSARDGGGARSERDQQRLDAERGARLEIGRAVRSMLMPRERHGRHGPFAFEFHVGDEMGTGGDWLFHWQNGGERCFLFGRVQGRGAPAALGVAAVASFLQEAKSTGLTLDDTLRHLNDGLLELFDRRVTTTVAAVSAADDGSVELHCAGGLGFFVFSRDGLSRPSLPSSPLGLTVEAEMASGFVPLHDGDVLFAATEGLLDAAGAERLEARLEAWLDEAQPPRIDSQQLRRLILEIGGRRSDEDQTLFLLTRLAG